MSIDDDPYLELRMASFIKAHGPLAAGIDSSSHWMATENIFQGARYELPPSA